MSLELFGCHDEHVIASDNIFTDFMSIMMIFKIDLTK